jgi:hypothetical protein
MGGYGSGRHGKAGRKATPVLCPHCGETVKKTEARRGHPGCTRAKRRWGGHPKRAKNAGKIAGLVREPVHGEMVLDITREQLAERIGAMGSVAFGQMARRLLAKRGTGWREWKRAG